MTWLESVRGWVLDVDGCLVRTARAGGDGGSAIPGAIDFMTSLAHAGHRVLVCTNASALPPHHYAEHLRYLGLPVRDEDFVTAGSAAADHIAALHPGAAVVALGGTGITDPLLERGLTLCQGENPGACPAVVVGAGPAYTHAEINTACLAVEAGAVLYVTQDQPWFHGGVGRSVAISAVMAAAITWATGVDPIVTGKPSQTLAKTLLRRLDVAAEQVAVVGDAAAEIRLARAMGARSVAVLSGALDPDKIAGLGPDFEPDLVVDDVAELHHHLTSHPPHIPGDRP